MDLYRGLIPKDRCSSIEDLISISIALYEVRNAHEGQFRKHSQTPYVHHPITVACMVGNYGGSRNAIIAALAHDCVEDVDDFDLNEFLDKLKLPDEITNKKIIWGMVLALTKNDTIVDRTLKLTDSCIRIVKVDPEAILIKICDRIHNLSDIDGFDKKFRIKYLNESETLVFCLQEKAMEYGYDDALDELNESIRNMKTSLGDC
jgi:guanosine-3',5'-bis(diphosphate) 3'-pyrophosphohydrolase